MATKNDRSIEMLTTALGMEEKGKAFYEKAVASCKNKLGVEIFTTLMRDEFIHIERIRKIYGELTGGQQWSDDWMSYQENHGDLGAMFKELALKHASNIKAETGDIEALDVGIDFEQKAVEFYELHLKAATDPLERKFIEQMVVEEKGHHAVLVDTKFFLSNPAAWYVEKEHAGFDG